MANRENEPVIREEDASHKRTLKTVGLALGGLIVLVLVVQLFRNLFVSRPEQVEKPAADTTSLDQATRTGVADKATDEFAGRVAQAITREEKQAEQQKEDPALVAQRLFADREELRRQREQLEGMREGSPAFFSSSDSVSSGSNQQALSQWESQEAQRVLSSRQADLQVNLGEQGLGSVGGAAAGGFVTGGISSTSRTPTTIATTREQQLQAIQAERERLMQLQNQLNAVKTGETVGVPAATSAQSATVGTSQVVGQPAPVVNNQPLAGQLLLPMATVIRAALDTKVISDYPGPFRGMIIDDVYDSTERFILIPKGSRVSGSAVKISNINEAIEARMGLVVEWVILPNGKKISFDKATTLDREGIAGIKDQVNHHVLAQVLGAAAFAVIDSETQNNVVVTGSGSVIIENTFSDELGQVFADVARKYINLTPTITLNPGMPMRIYLVDEMYIYPWEVVGESLYPRG